MGAKRVSVLVGILVLGGCDRNDPVQPHLMADLVSDVTPPTLAAFDFSPKSINTSDGPVTVTVSYTVTDDLSGATFVEARFCNPSNSVCVSGQSDFAATTSKSGSIELTFPQYSMAGTWTLYYVRVLDAIGNDRFLFPEDVTALGFPTTLTVSSTLQDVTPPALTAFDFSPRSINTGDGSATVTVSYTVTDDLTGATFVEARFCNPSNSVCVSGQSDFAATTSKSGSIELTFPQYSTAGTWTLYYVRVLDAIGNDRFLFPEDVTALGFPTTLTVSSTLQDVTPPTLTAFDFSPKSINTSDGSVTVTVSYTVTDDLTGTTFVEARFCNPSNSVCVSGSSDFASTTSKSGSFELNFPQYSMAGTWTLSYVRVLDAIGNDRFLFPEDITALGFPTILSVVNAELVAIDIQPGSSVNTIKPSKRGKVTVAVLSSAGLAAASQVDRSSLTFGHTGSEQSLVACAKEGEDVNGDGLLDLVCQFYVQQTGFQVGDVEGVLRGRTADQIPVEGRDAVRILK